MKVKCIGVLFATLIYLIIPTQQERNPTCGDVGSNKDTLLLTIVLFRHGDRTPCKTYPNDIYKEDAWADWGGFGHLTQVGMKQHYEFGKWIRNCYDGFLNERYNPKELYVRSTDLDRTLESVEAHLAGAYPPKVWQRWNEEVGQHWMPIPIHTVPRADDYLLIPEITCPPYQAQIMDVYTNHPRVKQTQTENQALLDYMAKNAGLPTPGDLNNVTYYLSDPLSVEVRKNMKLPDWVNSTMLEKLDNWADLILVFVKQATEEMVKYAAGDLIHNMRQLLVNKTKGLVTQKHIIYSGHDTTMIALLAAYGALDRDKPQSVPSLASSIITELHYDKAEKTHFVKAFFRNSVDTVPSPLQIRTCGNTEKQERCYLDDFVEVLEPVSLENKKSTCFPGQKTRTDLDENSIIAIAVTSTLVGILVIVTVVFLLRPICKKQSQNA